jgi:putative chitinase
MARTKTIELETETKKISWGDSYMSLLLGMVVVVVIGFIIFTFAKNKGELGQTSSVRDDIATQEKVDKQKSSALPKTYIVVAGDDLWSVSEKLYKSGYNWVDIAKANNLANPSVIHAGVKLTIPDVKPKVITMAQPTEKVSEMPKTNSIKGSSYTVVSGDNLWDIAVRAYSDGYRFVEIAKVNNIGNPDLIFAGNKLTIPRE